MAASEFAPELLEQVPALPIWKDPEMIGIGKEALRYLIVIAVLAFVAFGVIKPLMKSVITSYSIHYTKLYDAQGWNREREDIEPVVQILAESGGIV